MCCPSAYALDHSCGATLLLERSNGACRRWTSSEILLKRVEHQFLDRFHQNGKGHTADSFEEGTNIIVHKESKGVVMREGDKALIATEFAEVYVTEATDKTEAIVEPRRPRVIFSEQWVSMLYAVLCTVCTVA